MRIGLVGLGRMGSGLAGRLRRHGIEVLGYDVDQSRSEVSTIPELIERLEAPKIVWVMVPAGAATESAIDSIARHLAADDLVVDGGNSHYPDSIRRGRLLAERGVGFVDAGVSGGIWGEAQGYGLMVGGTPPDVGRLGPVFEALAPPGGFAHVGPVGAGHFTKMVHNAVEYGLMEAYGEGYELLRASDLGVDADAAMGAWRHGTVVRSWLLDLLVEALEVDPGLAAVRGFAEDSGEGRWALADAVRLGVPAPALSAAVFARFRSRQEDSLAMRVVAALRHQFGGHALR
ncbi:MAG: phosphogluconate dehydrogenase (NAD(+)-dependent, decarboxylating) [Acidimicrobiia bacterium]